jgi:hypothetical protein
MATANGGFRAGDEIERLTPADIARGRLMINAARSGMPGAMAGAAASPPSPPSPRVTFAPVFFPGVTDFSLATSITLGVAEERSGVDVQVQLVPTARVEGTVKLPEGIAPSNVVVTIASNGPMAGWLGGLPQSKRLDPAGRFVMTGVAPGAYSVKARPSGGAASGAPPGPAPSTYWAQADVVVDGHDQQVAMELQPGMAISGHLAFDGATPPPTDLAGLRFNLMPFGSGANLGAGPSGGTTDAAGKFSFPGVAPDRFRLTYSLSASWSRNWTLKSAVAAGKDVMDGGLEVKPGTDVELVVTFTDHPSELTGALQDTSGRAAPDYFIIVFPGDRAFWTPGSRRVRMIRPGSDGQFSVTGLPAGEYRVAALTDVVNGEWYNPAFLEGLLPASVTVALAEGQKTTQNLKIGG